MHFYESLMFTTNVSRATYTCDGSLRPKDCLLKVRRCPGRKEWMKLSIKQVTAAGLQNEQFVLAVAKTFPIGWFPSSMTMALRLLSRPSTSHRCLGESRDISLARGISNSIAAQLKALSDDPHVLYLEDRLQQLGASHNLGQYVSDMKESGFIVNFRANIINHRSSVESGCYETIEIHPVIDLGLLHRYATRTLHVYTRNCRRSSAGIDTFEVGYQYPLLAAKPCSFDALRVRDLVYVRGPMYAFAFKPASTRNGFNAVCVGTGDGHRLGTFSSFSKTDHSLADLEQVMDQAFRSPLTRRDLVELFTQYTRWPDAQCAMSPMSRKEA